MINVNIDSVKGNSFIGHVYCEDLNSKQIEQLGLVITDYVQEIKVEASITSKVDSDDYVQVSIEELTLINGKNRIELEESEYNYDDLCLELETGPHIADWIINKKADESDYYFDFYRETMGDR